MRQDLTDIIIVLDRSGSMSSVASDTIGGFNRFIEDQRKVPGDAILTLAQFDHEYEIVHDGKNIKDVPALTSETFVPRGNTALLDAIGRTINATGSRLEKLDESSRPDTIIFVIITDGFENASKEYTRDKVFSMIKHQTEQYNWRFQFLGANQDAIATAAGMGISGTQSMTYASNAIGTQSAYASLASNTRRLRSGNTAGFSQKERDEQKAAGAKT